MEPGKYDKPEQPLTTTLGTTLGADAIPIETPTSDDARRAMREPVPGEEHFVGRSGPGPKIMAADTLEGDDIVNAAGVVARGSLDGYRVGTQRRAQRRRQRLFRLIVLAWFHDDLLKLPSVGVAAMTSIRQLPI